MIINSRRRQEILQNHQKGFKKIKKTLRKSQIKNRRKRPDVPRIEQNQNKVFFDFSIRPMVFRCSENRIRRCFFDFLARSILFRFSGIEFAHFFDFLARSILFRFSENRIAACFSISQSDLFYFDFLKTKVLIIRFCGDFFRINFDFCRFLDCCYRVNSYSRKFCNLKIDQKFDQQTDHKNRPENTPESFDRLGPKLIPRSQAPK